MFCFENHLRLCYIKCNFVFYFYLLKRTPTGF